MKRSSVINCFVTVLLLAAFAFSLSGAKTPANTNWAGWRGPDGQGISSETNLPAEWSNTKNVLWKTAIPGVGYSQPIIWDKKVFLTTSIEGAAAP
ncbi:MAG: hypothetical protein ACKV2V_14445, partial [Blastocatellia bacterium]